MSVQFGKIFKVSPIHDFDNSHVNAKLSLPGFDKPVTVFGHPSFESKDVLELTFLTFTQEHETVANIEAKIPTRKASFFSRLKTGTLFGPRITVSEAKPIPKDHPDYGSISFGEPQIAPVTLSEDENGQPKVEVGEPVDTVSDASPRSSGPSWLIPINAKKLLPELFAELQQDVRDLRDIWQAQQSQPEPKRDLASPEQEAEIQWYNNDSVTEPLETFKQKFLQENQEKSDEA